MSNRRHKETARSVRRPLKRSFATSCGKSRRAGTGFGAALLDELLEALKVALTLFDVSPKTESAASPATPAGGSDVHHDLHLCTAFIEVVEVHDTLVTRAAGVDPATR